MTSERVEQLDFAAEVFYRRLMSKVDDHGLYDARPSVLRASLYPLRVDRVREADIARWIAACEKAGVIALYQHDGKPFLQMLDTRWSARSAPKYPLPPANGCEQPLATATLDVFVDGVVFEEEKRPRKRGFDAEAVELPEWLSRDLWGLWVKDRKARGKGMTEAAAALSLKKLGEFRGQGVSPQAVIEHSIANGYQGLYAPARNGSQRATPPSKDTGQTAAILAGMDERAATSTPPPLDVLNRVKQAIKTEAL